MVSCPILSDRDAPRRLLPAEGVDSGAVLVVKAHLNPAKYMPQTSVRGGGGAVDHVEISARLRLEPSDAGCLSFGGSAVFQVSYTTNSICRMRRPARCAPATSARMPVMAVAAGQRAAQ